MQILKGTETEGKVLGKNWSGRFQVGCDVFVEAATLKFRVHPDRPWVTASSDGVTDIIVNKAGYVTDVTLVSAWDYQFVTPSQGTEIWIARHDSSEGVT